MALGDFATPLANFFCLSSSSTSLPLVAWKSCLIRCLKEILAPVKQHRDAVYLLK